MTSQARPEAARPEAARPDAWEWPLTVVEAFDVGPHMRRVVLTCDRLAEIRYEAGQALVLQMPLPGGGTGRRDYTIRALDRAERRLAIDFVLHGNTPAPDWARRARAGDAIVALGPRGRTIIAPDADWHLFCGDETGLPAILHMLETLAKGARAFAFIEVADEAAQLPVATQADVVIDWVHRGARPPGPSALMLDVLSAFALPEGRGRAYLIGETSNVRAQRHHLIARGLPRDRIASEGYWRPGRVGGHDHIDD